MNRRIVAILAVIAVLVGAVVAVAVLQPEWSASDTSAADSATSVPSGSVDDAAEDGDVLAEPTSDPDDGEGVAPGVYAGYSDSALAAAEGRVLLFFSADWCAQCRQLDGDISSRGAPDGVTILQVDYDERQDLRQAYGVTQQTTFVEVDSSGARVQENYVAYSDPRLAAVVDDYL